MSEAYGRSFCKASARSDLQLLSLTLSLHSSIPSLCYESRGRRAYRSTGHRAQSLSQYRA
eukprot:645085-Rhodomonas_salina.2